MNATQPCGCRIMCSCTVIQKANGGPYKYKQHVLLWFAAIQYIVVNQSRLWRRWHTPTSQSQSEHTGWVCEVSGLEEELVGSPQSTQSPGSCHACGIGRLTKCRRRGSERFGSCKRVSDSASPASASKNSLVDRLSSVERIFPGESHTSPAAFRALFDTSADFSKAASCASSSSAETVPSSCSRRRVKRGGMHFEVEGMIPALLLPSGGVIVSSTHLLGP
mmetsp:Transcript_26289/g.51093  ORF Transcript_26289/g.51093 Transcript_26289/m.51093 type:complete len:220 (-) Transcript_26289:266-925(-)